MTRFRERGRAGAAEPVRITTAPVSRHDDLVGRQRRYVFSMVIRTACFVGAVAVGPGWLRWVLVAGAVLLPYVAVVIANSAAPTIEGSPLREDDLSVGQIEQRRA